MVVKEPNFKRRAQRIKLPIMVELGGEVYETKDFSVLGVGLKLHDKGLNIGDRVKARLILPFKEASIVFPVDMILKRFDEDGAGFEFVDLSPQKRRALRQYIEFAIEGRLDEVETVSATLHLPTIYSPITESLALAEEEQANLYKSFKRHMFFGDVL